MYDEPLMHRHLPDDLPIELEDIMREDEIREWLRGSGYGPTLIDRFLGEHRPVMMLLGERVWDRRVTEPEVLLRFRAEYERQVECRRQERQRNHGGPKPGIWVTPYEQTPEPEPAVAPWKYRLADSGCSPSAQVVELESADMLASPSVPLPVPVEAPSPVVPPSLPVAVPPERELVSLVEFVRRYALPGENAARTVYQLARRAGVGARRIHGRTNLYWLGELEGAVLRGAGPLGAALAAALADRTRHS